MKTFKILAWFGVLAWAAASVLQAAPIPTAPIHTNKLRFRIPFHYDPAELSRLGAREIRLYASRDRGRTWQQVQSVAPDAGKFNFQAQGDGEHWFIVRTLDSRSHLHPDGTVTDPGLMVIVDATPPRLELQLRQPAPGKVQLLWAASDEHLDLTQLRLEYLQPGSPDWQPVAIVPKAVGQTGWALPQGGVVSVRGSIADFARNVTSDQVQLRIAPGSQTVPRPDGPGGRQPVAGPANSLRDPLALTLPERFPSSAEWHDQNDADDLPDGPVGEAPLGLPQTAENSAHTASRNSFVSLRPDNAPIIRSRQRDEESIEEAPVQPASRQPSNARQRVVNTRRFQIGYKLQDVGPSGVSSVELYITPDGGRTWYRYGADDDNQSPMHVEVPREGTYGFALGVHSGAGLASEPPQNGDAPAIVVVVDQTPPKLELVPPQPAHGRSPHKLIIAWKYSDEHPAERPVSLFYSVTGQAPWQAIAGPIENSGNYTWSIDPRAGVKFYLRIEARDQAGNVMSVESAEPVVIDLSRPTAKIIDVEFPAENGLPRS